MSSGMVIWLVKGVNRKTLFRYLLISLFTLLLLEFFNNVNFDLKIFKLLYFVKVPF